MGTEMTDNLLYERKVAERLSVACDKASAALRVFLKAWRKISGDK